MDYLSQMDNPSLVWKRPLQLFLGGPEFNSPSIRRQLVASCWVGVFNPVLSYLHLRGMPDTSWSKTLALSLLEVDIKLP